MIKRVKKISIYLAILFICVLIVPNKNSANAFEYNKAEFSQINAKGVAVVELSSGRFLYEQNAEMRLPMASTTKIATCITVIENCENLKKVVRVPDCAVGVEGSSIYLSRGESHTIEDLLYGLMLQSGNDCAVTLACAIGGNVDNFAKMMNETAKKAGATNTNFVNPHGLHDDKHYTTASDLAKISVYAMKNPVFRQIVSTKTYKMPWTGREYDRVLVNKNKILSTLHGGCGIKTGYTKKAGRCLVSAVEREDMTVICVVLNCPGMFQDSTALLNRAFENYQNCDIVDGETAFQVDVNDGKVNYTVLKSEKSFSYPLTNEEKNLIEIKTVGVKNMDAPVKKGEKNGKIEVYLQKRLIFSSNLYTIYDVESKNLWEKLMDLLRN